MGSGCVVSDIAPILAPPTNLPPTVCPALLVDRGLDERGRDGLAGPVALAVVGDPLGVGADVAVELAHRLEPVSYTHLRAHETRHDLVCRLLLEKKKKT